MPLTESDLDRLAALRAAATPAPWRVQHQFNVTANNRSVASNSYSSNDEQEKAFDESIANIAFIAAAGNDFEALLAAARLGLEARAVLPRMIAQCSECDGGIQQWVLGDGSEVEADCPRCAPTRAFLAAHPEGGE